MQNAIYVIVYNKYTKQSTFDRKQRAAKSNEKKNIANIIIAKSEITYEHALKRMNVQRYI